MYYPYNVKSQESSAEHLRSSLHPEEHAPDLRFTAPEFDGAEDKLGSFAPKLIKIMNHIARRTYGDDALQGHSDLRISPELSATDDFVYNVIAWHTTPTEQGTAAMTELLDVRFDLVSDGENVYFRYLNDQIEAYFDLTTVETLALHELGWNARIHRNITAPLSGGDEGSEPHIAQ